MPEDSKNPFCRDGGCYNCEVEIEEAAKLVRSIAALVRCWYRLRISPQRVFAKPRGARIKGAHAWRLCSFLRRSHVVFFLVQARTFFSQKGY